MGANGKYKCLSASNNANKAAAPRWQKWNNLWLEGSDGWLLACIINPMESKSRPNNMPLYWKCTWSNHRRPGLQTMTKKQILASTGRSRWKTRVTTHDPRNKMISQTITVERWNATHWDDGSLSVSGNNSKHRSSNNFVRNKNFVRGLELSKNSKKAKAGG